MLFRSLLDHITPMMLNAQRRILDPLTPEQQRQFMQLLELLVETNNDHSRAPSEAKRPDASLGLAVATSHAR